MYIKLGQIAATRVDLLPADVCEALAELQNRVEPIPTDGRRIGPAHRVRCDLDAVFSEFEWSPLAAASIGQTHRRPAGHGGGRRRRRSNGPGSTS